MRRKSKYETKIAGHSELAVRPVPVPEPAADNGVGGRWRRLAGWRAVGDSGSPRRAARKYPVMIYTNKKGFDNLIRDQFKDCHLWICTFSQPDDSLAWILWQHSHRGHVDGIEGRVDLDIFNGDSAQWAKWTEQTKAQFKESTALFSQ